MHMCVPVYVRECAPVSLYVCRSPQQPEGNNGTPEFRALGGFKPSLALGIEPSCSSATIGRTQLLNHLSSPINSTFISIIYTVYLNISFLIWKTREKVKPTSSETKTGSKKTILNTHCLAHNVSFEKNTFFFKVSVSTSLVASLMS